MGSIEDIDYVQFCGGDRPDWESLGLQAGSTAESRITANVGTSAGQPLFENSGADGWQELRDIMASKSVRILDVRPRTEFGICHLPWSIRKLCEPFLL